LRERSPQASGESAGHDEKEWTVIISGIVMASREGRLKQLCESVDAIPWAEVHFSDPEGRVIATIEARDVEESVSHLKELQCLPDAVMAELSQFCVEGDYARIQNPTTSNSMVEETNPIDERELGKSG
jgi:nitrate reductase NapAB chaperone NapD